MDDPKISEMRGDGVFEGLAQAVKKAYDIMKHPSTGLYAYELYSELGRGKAFPIEVTRLGEYRATLMFIDVLAILEERGWAKRGRDGRYRAK